MVLAVASAVTMMIGTRRHDRLERRMRRVSASPSRRGPERSVRIRPGSISRARSITRASSLSTAMSREPKPFNRSDNRRAAAGLWSTMSTRRTTGAIFCIVLASKANKAWLHLEPKKVNSGG